MTIIIIFVAAKMVILAVTGTVLWKVFGPELRSPRPNHAMPGVRCVYCHFSPALFHSEEQSWEGDELVFTRTYECRQCHMPFWQVERVQPVSQKTM